MIVRERAVEWTSETSKKKDGARAFRFSREERILFLEGRGVSRCMYIYRGWWERFFSSGALISAQSSVSVFSLSPLAPAAGCCGP